MVYEDSDYTAMIAKFAKVKTYGPPSLKRLEVVLRLTFKDFLALVLRLLINTHNFVLV